VNFVANIINRGLEHDFFLALFAVPFFFHRKERKTAQGPQRLVFMPFAA